MYFLSLEFFITGNQGNSGLFYNGCICMSEIKTFCLKKKTKRQATHQKLFSWATYLPCSQLYQTSCYSLKTDEAASLIPPTSLVIWKGELTGMIETCQGDRNIKLLYVSRHLSFPLSKGLKIGTWDNFLKFCTCV